MHPHDPTVTARTPLALSLLVVLLLLLPGFAHAQTPPWDGATGTCWKGGTGAVSGSHTFDACLTNASATWPILTSKGSQYWSQVYGPGGVPNASGMPCTNGCVRAGDRASTTPRTLFHWSPSTTTFPEDPCQTIEECLEPPEPTCTATSNGYFIETAPPQLNYQPAAMVCSAGCAYAYSGSAFSADDDSILNTYTNLQTDCSGEEADIPLTPADDVDPPQPDPCSTYENVIKCFPTEDPPNCYMNDSGVPGASIPCPGDYSDPESERCGFIAGAYTCVDSGERSCGTVNGTFVCFAKTPSGQFSSTPISTSDPDHPINGGNANGNSTDDVFTDPAEVASNALPAADVKREMQRQGIIRTYSQTVGSGSNYPSPGGGGEGEFDDSDIIAAIEGLGDRIQGLFDSVFGDPADAVVPDFDAELAAAHGSSIEAIEGAGTDPGMSFDVDASGMSGLLGGLIPAPGSCGMLVLELHPSLAFDVDLCQLNTVRTVLGWLFYVATVYALFSLIVQRPREA
jgi:hypothetical protein